MSPSSKNIIVGTTLIALAAGVIASRWLWQRPEIDASNTVLADFSLPDLDGQTHWLSEWQGHTIVLNFWASWCGPCRQEIPLLIDVHKRYQAQGVRVVGVAIDDHDAVAKFAAELHIPYPLLLAPDTGPSIMARYGDAQGFLPYSVVIGPDGAIRSRKLGSYAEKELETELDALVNPDTSSIMTK